MSKQIADGRFGGLDIKSVRRLSNGAMEGTLWLNGKKVAYIEDDGRGGEPMYHYLADNLDERQAIEAAVEAEVAVWSEWSKAHGYDSSNLDILCEEIEIWKDDQRSAKKMVKQGAKSVVKISQSNECRELTRKWDFEHIFYPLGNATDSATAVAEYFAAQYGKEISTENNQYKDLVEVLAVNGKVLDAGVMFRFDHATNTVTEWNAVTV